MSLQDLQLMSYNSFKGKFFFMQAASASSNMYHPKDPITSVCGNADQKMNV